jgi:hypothetical protein
LETGQLGQNSWDSTVGTGQPRQDGLYRITGEDSGGRTAKTGQKKTAQHS